MWPRSASKPSETSMAAVAIPRSASPSATRGCGRCKAARQSDNTGSAKTMRPCRCARPSAARPGVPDTQISSPGCAPERSNARACRYFAEDRHAEIARPLRRVAADDIDAECVGTGEETARKLFDPAFCSGRQSDGQQRPAGLRTHRGQVRDIHRQRFPAEILGDRYWRRKCVPATSMSVEMTSSQPAPGRTMAPSSPTPSTVCRVGRLKWRSIRANSEGMPPDIYFERF